MSGSSEEVLALSELDMNDLVYRGEGNLSLVVALKSLKKVIRISKIERHQKDVDLTRLKEKLLNEIGFSWNVMRKLFAPGIWIDRYLLVGLEARQMTEIKDKVEDLRPDHRKSKTLPTQNYLALLIDDYCDFRREQLQWIERNFPACRLSGPVYSVELKPKQGFVSAESAGLGICKFRLRQQEKLSASLIDRPSDYCPLDLFSGDEQRMRFALISLIAEPQNNFRLFIDKEHVSQPKERLSQSDDLGEEKLVRLLVSVLGHPFELNEQTAAALPRSSVASSDSTVKCEYHFKLHKSSSSKPLNQGCVLKSILDVQRLDEIGSSRAFELYKHFESKYKAEFDEWLKWSKNGTELLRFSGEHKSEVNNLMDQLTNFLYSMTAKDCSVLITLQKALNTPATSQTSGESASRCEKASNHSKRLCFYTDAVDGSVYLFTIALVDLDRKQPEKAETTHRNDQKRIEEFLASQ